MVLLFVHSTSGLLSFVHTGMIVIVVFKNSMRQIFKNIVTLYLLVNSNALYLNELKFPNTCIFFSSGENVPLWGHAKLASHL